MILVALLWPHQEWYLDLLFMLVDEPLDLPKIWNLLIQPHVMKFHRDLNIVRLHTWKLSSSSLGGFFGGDCSRDCNSP